MRIEVGFDVGDGNCALELRVHKKHGTLVDKEVGRAKVALETVVFEMMMTLNTIEAYSILLTIN